jgi:hypothetical protein
MEPFERELREYDERRAVARGGVNGREAAPNILSRI